ncbi:MAG: cadherin-like domain-containing protein [Actinomycetota bacterium]|nr:cadherin-like domain-containing protein [Actinomycetota bacterium]
MCSALLLALAAPASAITRKQATKNALAALGPAKPGERVTVFRLPKPLKAGTVVTQRGSKRRLAKVGRERAFFFYRDSGPGQPYPHAGRVALVGAKKGKVKLSGGIMWQPLINGRLPVFLKTSAPGEYVVASSESLTVDQPPFPIAPELTAEDDPAPPPDDGKDSAPKASSQTVRAKTGSPKRITLTGTDEDGDLLTFFITKPPRNGTLSGQPPDLTYTSNTGYLGNDSFHFKVSDGDHESSNAAVVQIDVVPPGLPPVVNTSAGCTSYTEQSPAVAIDDQLTVSDVDDPVLESARVRVDFSDQPAPDPEDPVNNRLGDELVFTDQNGISGSYNERTATLDLSGTATVAQYEAALRTVRYRNLSNPNPPPTRDIIFTANDAGNDSLPATKQVCIVGGAGGNDRPTSDTGSEGALSYIENDGPIPVDGAFIVADPDSATLSSAYVKFLPYVTLPGEDDEGNPTPGSTQDTFDPAQDDLVFQDQNGITGEYNDSTGVLTLTGTASVADYQAALQSVAYENVSEDPTADPRRVEFRVTDSSGANSIPSRRDIFVTPVNDAPVATASEGSTDYTGAATVIDAALTAGDVDDTHLEGAQVRIASGFQAGDALAFTDTAQITGIYDAESGILTLSGSAPEGDYQAALRSVTFDTTAQTGSRSIEFTVNDGELDSAPTAKHLEINDPPVLDASDDALAYTENAGPVAVDSGITATDVDSSTLSGATVTISSNYVAGEDVLAFTDTAEITGSLDPTGDTLTLSGTASVADYQTALQSVTYENSSDDPSTATRTVTVKADDGVVFNNLSNAVTRDIAITAVNDAPAVDASDGSTAYTEGDAATPIDSALTVGDADDTNIEGATVSITSGLQSGDSLGFEDTAEITGQYDPESGVLTLTGSTSEANFEAALRSVTYSHSGDDPDAARTVEFSVSDGELSGSDTKDLAVTGVNDRPVLDPTDDALAYTAGDGPVALDSGITASDVDSDTLTEATITISSNYVAGEDVLAFTDTAEITGSFDETQDTLTLSGTASVAAYQAALQSITYENTSATPSTATRTVTFKANDGGATDSQSDAVTRDITVAGPNEAPVVQTSTGSTAFTIGDPATAIDPALTVTDANDTNLEGASVTISSGFDPGDVLSYDDTVEISGQYNAEAGVLTLTGSASVAAYEAALRSVGFSGVVPGTRTVDFKVNDGTADSNTASKSVDVSSPL